MVLGAKIYIISRDCYVYGLLKLVSFNKNIHMQNLFSFLTFLKKIWYRECIIILQLSVKKKLKLSELKKCSSNKIFYHLIGINWLFRVNVQFFRKCEVRSYSKKRNLSNEISQQGCNRKSCILSFDFILMMFCYSLSKIELFLNISLLLKFNVMWFFLLLWIPRIHKEEIEPEEKLKV